MLTGPASLYCTKQIDNRVIPPLQYPGSSWIPPCAPCTSRLLLPALLRPCTVRSRVGEEPGDRRRGCPARTQDLLQAALLGFFKEKVTEVCVGVEAGVVASQCATAQT